MRVTRATAVVVGLVYVFLWVLALHGVSSLVPVLAVPLVIALLVAFGVWLNRFMGITPRAQHFQEPSAATASEPPSPSTVATAAVDLEERAVDTACDDVTAHDVTAHDVRPESPRGTSKGVDAPASDRGDPPR